MKPGPTPAIAEYEALVRLAAEANLPYSSLRTAGFNGEFPVLKLGREGSRRESWYVRRADFCAWLERRTVTNSKPTKATSGHRLAAFRVICNPNEARSDDEQALCGLSRVVAGLSRTEAADVLRTLPDAAASRPASWEGHRRTVRLLDGKSGGPGGTSGHTRNSGNGAPELQAGSFLKWR